MKVNHILTVIIVTMLGISIGWGVNVSLRKNVTIHVDRCDMEAAALAFKQCDNIEADSCIVRCDDDHMLERFNK